MPRLKKPPIAVSSLIRAFIAESRLLEQVVQVLVETRLEEYPRVWTVIDAPAFEFAYREPIFEAQLRASEACPDTWVEFRLVNLNELTQPSDTVLPAGAVAVYQR